MHFHSGRELRYFGLPTEVFFILLSFLIYWLPFSSTFYPRVVLRKSSDRCVPGLSTSFLPVDFQICNVIHRRFPGSQALSACQNWLLFLARLVSTFQGSSLGYLRPFKEHDTAETG